MTAILGYLVNSAVRTRCLATLAAKFIAPVCTSRWRGGTELTLWCLADGGQHHQLSNTNLSTLVLARILGAGVAGDTTWRTTWPLCHR